MRRRCKLRRLLGSALGQLSLGSVQDQPFEQAACVGALGIGQ
jgi:hypothetical protein